MILFGRPPQPITMSTNRRYDDTEILNRMTKLRMRKKDLWLQVEQERILLQAPDDSLASKVASAYHDSVARDAPLNDGFEEETALMEARAEQHMFEPSSEEESDSDALHDAYSKFQSVDD